MSKTKATPKTWPTTGVARVPQAAEFLGFSRDTIYRMVNDGELEKTLVRGLIRIPWQALHKIAGTK